MKIEKERVDILLVERGLCETREKAKRSIMAGIVFTGTNRIDKAGEKIDKTAPLEVKGKECPYVGRGGWKLEKALKEFNIDATGRILVDIGSSTGGFTDCALQNGAKLSYAIDVGSNQLAWKLRSDPRVVVMEKTNFRYVTPDQLHEGLPNLASIDVSFISLRLIFPTLIQILAEDSDVVALVKPQFEAGREQVGKKGIVRDAKVHKDVISDIVTFCESLGLKPQALTFSPITGGDGNIEFLLHLKWNSSATSVSLNIDEVVNIAHNNFKNAQQS